MNTELNLNAALAAAEEAAGRDDMLAAEGFLRRAIELQQAVPGTHLDLADTLNNLGVVCERLGKDEEAERCYRDACATARAGLPPSHPSVTTSEANLREFCAARGLPFEPALRLSAASAEPAPQPDPKSVASGEPALAPQPLPIPAPVPVPTLPATSSPWPAPGTRWRPLPLALVAVVAFAAMGLFLFWRSAAAPVPAITTSLKGDQGPPPKPATPPPPSERSPTPPEPTSGQPTSEEPPRADGTQPSLTPRVVSAAVCQSLQTGASWHCVPLSASVDGGAVYFYTRLAVSADTTVEHRWYHAGHLHRSVALRIAANPAGYRTYSRVTVTPSGGGDWRVELRFADGRVLSEKRFTVGP